MNVIGFVILGVLLASVLLAPRRWALVGMFGGILYLTQGQSIDVLGLNLYPMRVLTLAGFVRVLARGEWSPSMLNDIDKVLLLTYGYRTIVFILNSNGSAIYAIGWIVDAALSYLSFRGLLASFDDLAWFLRALAVLLVPYVAILFVESSTGDNLFAIVGGINEHLYRAGWPRCIGSFRHAILLGTFGASFLPLFIPIALIRKSRLWGILGTFLCLAIVFFSNSGGPLTCAMVAVLGWSLWFVRTKMAAVRISIVASLVALALAMKAPIWYLPAKISNITGGTGWHRSYLLDIAFQHIDNWWLAGMSVLETKDWFPYTIGGVADVINYYLDFGIAAGLVAMGLFCFLLVLSFSRLGRALRAIRFRTPVARREEFFLWGLGVVLTIHVINWFATTYFDQYYVVFFMQLAALSTLSHRCIRTRVTSVGQTRSARRQTPTSTGKLG